VYPIEETLYNPYLTNRFGIKTQLCTYLPEKARLLIAQGIPLVIKQKLRNLFVVHATFAHGVQRKIFIVKERVK
jgi:hypothetical protein